MTFGELIAAQEQLERQIARGEIIRVVHPDGDYFLHAKQDTQAGPSDGRSSPLTAVCPQGRNSTDGWARIQPG